MIIKAITNNKHVYFEVTKTEFETTLDLISKVPDGFIFSDDSNKYESATFLEEAIWYGINEGCELPNAPCLQSEFTWFVVDESEAKIASSKKINRKAAINFLICMASQCLTASEKQQYIVDIKTINNTDEQDFNMLLDKMNNDVDECHQMING